MKRITMLSLAILLSTGLAREARAQVVYAGGAPNGWPGYDIFDDFLSADDFQLSTAASFNALRFWGILPSAPAYSPDVFWQIFLDAGGAPGTSVAQGNALATPTLRGPSAFSGFDSWQFDLSLGPQSLGAGTYWLALHDAAPGTYSGSGLIWEQTNGGLGSDFAVEFIPDAQFTTGWSGNLAFELRNNVTAQVTPEPGTEALLATGLLALLALARRRRRRRRRPHC